MVQKNRKALVMDAVDLKIRKVMDFSTIRRFGFVEWLRFHKIDLRKKSRRELDIEGCKVERCLNCKSRIGWSLSQDRKEAIVCKDCGDDEIYFTYKAIYHDQFNRETGLLETIITAYGAHHNEDYNAR